MADGADNNTLLMVAAAAVVVAVVWSRRASAAPASSTGEMYAGGSARGRDLEAGSATTGFLEGVTEAAKAFGSLFSGISDLSQSTSSDDSYLMPSSPRVTGSADIRGVDNAGDSGLTPFELGLSVDENCKRGYVDESGIFVCVG
jgi:hypothetical protein